MPTATTYDTGVHAHRSLTHRTRVARPSLRPLCPLCASRENNSAFSDNGCELRSCKHCGLFFVNPYPRSQKRHSELTGGSIEGIDLLDCERRYAGEKLYYQRHFELIEEELRGAKSFLDVGCGTGHLLETLSERRHLRRVGIELNHEIARFARQKAKCEILEVPFEEFTTSERFDAITLINVFSHIPSFDGLFAALNRVLAPGGKVILRTSEMSPHVSRWNQVHWGIPDDLHFLGLNTLSFLCRRYGFEVRRHIRLAYEDELFSRSRWLQMGRHRGLNLIKKLAVRTPGALRTMRAAYRALLGKKLFVSFIVLTPVQTTPPTQQP